MDIIFYAKNTSQRYCLIWNLFNLRLTIMTDRFFSLSTKKNYPIVSFAIHLVHWLRNF